jgi:hypothetical protein
VGRRPTLSVHAIGVSGAALVHPVVAAVLPSIISTAQELFPQDSATLSVSSGGTPAASVDLFLYGANNPTCAPNGAAPVHTEPNVNFTKGWAETSNDTFSVSLATSEVDHWKVVYDSDNTHIGVTSDCDEKLPLTIENG